MSYLCRLSFYSTYSMAVKPYPIPFIIVRFTSTIHTKLVTYYANVPIFQLRNLYISRKKISNSVHLIRSFFIYKI